MKDCIQKVKEYVAETGLRITPERIEEIGALLKAQGGDGMSKAEIYAKMQEFVSNELGAMQAKHQAARAMTKAIELQGRERIFDRDFGASPFENLRALMDGSSLKQSFGGNLDPRRLSSAINQELVSMYARATEKFADVLRSGEIDKDILTELHALQNGLEEGKTQNGHALEIAKGINAVQNEMVDRMKAVNPYFEPAESYLVKQTHDSAKIMAADKEEWVGAALKAFGEKSFPGMDFEGKVMALGDIYERIISGTYSSPLDDLNGDKFSQTPGSGSSIFRRMTQQRKLIATSPEAFADYMTAYGKGNVDEIMKASMRQTARNIALLDKFGPVPQETYNRWYNYALATATGAEKAELRAGKTKLDATFDNLIGTTDAPATTIPAKVVQAMAALNYLSKGGNGVLRALPDISLAATMVRDTAGKTIVQNAAELALSVAKFMGSGSAREAALNRLGLIAHSTIGDVFANLGAYEGVPGKLAGLADAYGSITLHKQWVDSLRAGIAQMVTSRLTDVTDQTFKEMPAHWQQGLLRYGIDPKAWDVIRQAVPEEAPNGLKHLTPESVRRLPDDVAQAWAESQNLVKPGAQADPRVLDLARNQLAQKLAVLINDHAESPTISPNTRQRAFMNQGYSINDPMGVALRMLTQFKMAATVSLDTYRRSYFSGQTLTGSLAGVASSVAMSAFFYTLGEYALQAAKGQTPEDPTSAAFMAKVALNSGGTGILGDVLSRTIDEHGSRDAGRAMLEALAGPTVGEGVKAFGVAEKYAQSLGGKSKVPNMDMTKLALENLPAQNLFWTRAVFDYYLFNGIKEFVGPGYLQHLETSVSQKPGLLDQRQGYFMLRPNDSARY